MNGERDLWCAVLETVISDALHGAPRVIFHDKALADLETERARNFILRPNRDFNLICYFAGLDPEAVRDRLRVKIEATDTPQGKPKRKAKTGKPKKAQITCTAFGETKTLSEWAREVGISYQTLRARIRVQGLDPEEALTAP